MSNIYFSMVQNIRFIIILLFLVILNVGFSEVAFSDPRSEGYVGSEQCFICHFDLNAKCIKEWQASKHHLTMQLVSNNNDIFRNPKMNAFLKKEDILAVIGHKDERYINFLTQFSSHLKAEVGGNPILQCLEAGFLYGNAIG